MRVTVLAPLIAIFGCAHQGAASAESAQPAVAEATPAPPPPPAAPSTPPQASAKPARLACAPIKVHFALDSDQLYDSEKPLLDVTAKCLSANDTQRVTIVGNADERGSVAYNQDLGQRRAEVEASDVDGRVTLQQRKRKASRRQDREAFVHVLDGALDANDVPVEGQRTARIPDDQGEVVELSHGRIMP